MCARAAHETDVEPSAYDEVTYERMQEIHLPQVLRIEKESFSSPWSRDSFLHELKASLSFPMVARCGERVLGYVVAWFIFDEAHIGNVAVVGEARRQGIGKGMMRWLLRQAIAQGCTFATLEVRESNVAARRLYEGMGFRAVGRRQGYYLKPNEDALVLLKTFE